MKMGNIFASHLVIIWKNLINKQKPSHPTSELVVSLQLYIEGHLLRALEDYGGQFITNKTELVIFSLPEFKLKKKNSWKSHVLSVQRVLSKLIKVIKPHGLLWGFSLLLARLD
jgi:hypothetical protein